MKAIALCSIFTAAFFTSASAQQPDFSKSKIETHKLSASTYMLVGEGGNLGVSVGEDAVFVVDDQFAPMTPKITAAIAKITKKPIKFVLNTHWHFDHVGGNENFGKAGAVIVAHENVRKRMSTEQMIEFFGMKFPPSPKPALPVVTFTTDVAFHLNGDEINIRHVPNAHTDGDAVVFFKNSNVLHSGDVFFNKMYPFIDTGNGGSVYGMIAAVDVLLQMANENTKIVPGHGPLATKADLTSYRDMLTTIADRIKAQVDAGKTIDEVKASTPTAEFDATWSKGFLPTHKFVELVYKSLKK